MEARLQQVAHASSAAPPPPPSPTLAHPAQASQVSPPNTSNTPLSIESIGSPQKKRKHEKKQRNKEKKRRDKEAKRGECRERGQRGGGLKEEDGEVVVEEGGDHRGGGGCGIGGCKPLGPQTSVGGAAAQANESPVAAIGRCHMKAALIPWSVWLGGGPLSGPAPILLPCPGRGEAVKQRRGGACGDVVKKTPGRGRGDATML